MSTQTGKTPPAAASKAKQQRASRRELARAVAILVLAGLIIAFAVVNLDQVKVDWLVGSGHAPLIIVIVISLVVGVVLTLFVDRLTRWRR